MKTLVTTLFIYLAFAVAAFAQTTQVDTAWKRTYSSNLGLIDYGREIKTDAAGNVYVGGHSIVNANQEGVTKIIKYDSNGVFKWQYTSAIDDLMEDMQVTSSGNIYYAGSRWTGSQWDFLLVKLNISGTVVWTQTFNGPGNGWDYGTALHVDASENVYITGYATAVANGYDFTTVKYNSAGQQQWNRSFPSFQPSYFNHAYDVVTDGSGSVYVSGYQMVSGRHFLTLVKYNSTGVQQWVDTTDTHGEWDQVSYTYLKADNNGNIYNLGNSSHPVTGCDILLVKYGPNGKAWTRTWNNPGNDSNFVSGGGAGMSYIDEALMIDGSGNILVMGTTKETLLDYMSDIVTLKYNPQGTLLWSHTYDGAANDIEEGYGLALDASGNVYVAGTSNHSNTGFEGLDYLTYKLDSSNGSLMWQRTFNGDADFVDEAHAIHVDAKNNVYVTGRVAASANILDPESHIVTIKYKQTSANPSAVPFFLENYYYSVYPNPAHHSLNIQVPNAGRSTTIVAKLINSSGQVAAIQEWKTPGNEQVLAIQTTTLPDGIYTLQLRVDELTLVRSVIVSHR